MGPGINPATGNMWSQSDMDICGGRMDNGKYKYYTTIDFPYYLQCYRGETGDTTGGAGSFDGNCGLNNSGCTRTNSSGRKRRSSTGRDLRTMIVLCLFTEPKQSMDPFHRWRYSRLDQFPLRIRWTIRLCQKIDERFTCQAKETICNPIGIWYWCIYCTLGQSASSYKTTIFGQSFIYLQCLQYWIEVTFTLS